MATTQQDIGEFARCCNEAIRNEAVRSGGGLDAADGVDPRPGSPPGVRP